MQKTKDSISLLSQKKIYYSLIGIGIFSLFFAAIYLSFQILKVQSKEKQLIQAQELAQDTVLKRKKRDLFLSRYISSDPQYIDYELESFHFLQQEESELESFLQHPAYLCNPALLNRINFHKKRENLLRFIEEDIQTTKLVRETVEKQLHSVEIKFEDLNELLFKIEYSEDSPQLLITDFHLKKKRTPLKNEVFDLQMQILNREFLKKTKRS